MAEAVVVIGQLGSAHGLQGWINVRSFTDPETNIFNYPSWLISEGKEWRAITVAETKVQGPKLVAHLKDCMDRTEAQRFSGRKIGVYRSQLPDCKHENEYYWADLVGCRVIDTEGKQIGTVDYLMETGSCDVMVVKSETGDQLIPFQLKNVIQEVNLEKRTITVAWNME